MKPVKIVLFSLTAGVLLGMALGVNIGREKPLLSNPFDKNTLGQQVKRIGGETLEQGGKVLEKTGKELQDKLGK
jgi:hypothetical protein